MNPNKYPKGFSLIELLVALLLFVGLATIVLPNFFSVVNRSRDRTAHFNAQSVANTYTVAKASGIKFPEDKLEVIRVLRAGIRTPNGTYLRITFPAEYDSEVVRYLQIDKSGEMFLEGISSSH